MPNTVGVLKRALLAAGTQADTAGEVCAHLHGQEKAIYTLNVCKTLLN